MKHIYKLIIILVIFSISFLAYLALQSSPPDWTGFGISVKDETINASKTLWDWLGLLIIPVAIVVLGLSFTQSEKIKARRSEEERTQNESLESFFEIMTKLILENNLSDNPSPEAKVIARARIHLAFSILDNTRKGQALQFLYESNLIDIDPKIKLLGANLRNVILDEIVLGESEIRGVYFNNASIQNANLNKAILIGCDFTKANLSKSFVMDLDLSYANLTNAKLMKMDLTSVNFEGVILTGANLKGSRITQAQLNGIFDKKGIKMNKKEVI